MPNRQVLEAVAQQRRRRRKYAQRAYRRHHHQVPDLIRQLASPSQAAYDRAFDLLSKMSDTIVSELLEALSDPTLDPFAADEVVSLLGTAGDQRAKPALWAFFQANSSDLERASTAALSLSALGDARVLPFVRIMLNAPDEEWVANAATSLIILGELEDVDRLRETHRRHLTSPEVREAVSNAVLTILGEADEATFNHTMDEIQASPLDQGLWADIWQILEDQFGGSPSARFRRFKARRAGWG